MLGEELGRGPVGVVYRGDHLDTGRVAAVKVIAVTATRTPDFLQKFPAEMLFLQRLNHPNVARFYDAGTAGESMYYAAEYVDGPDLATALQRRSRKADEPGLNWADDLLRIAVQLARALKHGHHRSVLHRGLKPANVLLAADGTVKLTDFGVAKVLGLPPFGATVDPWGTAGYLAPEHFTGKPYTKRSDLYALGGVLYTVVTGRPPFAASTAAEFMHKHCYTLPDRPAQFVPKLPTELDDLICNLMAKDPSRRPASATAVVEELDRIRGKLERKGVVAAWPADPGDPSGPLPAYGADDDPDDDDGRPPRPLMARPAVVVPLFLLVVGLFLAGVFWPRPGPEELYGAAIPLMESDDPADWDRAWDEYLEPMGRRYPAAYPDELAEARQKIADRRELNRAIVAGEKVAFTSEAERWYARGLALARVGDTAAARRVWQNLVAGFANVQAEKRWVKLAERGLTDLGSNPVDPPTPNLTAVLDQVRTMDVDGNADKAAVTRVALEDLYRDDPAALAKIRAVE